MILFYRLIFLPGILTILVFTSICYAQIDQELDFIIKHNPIARPDIKENQTLFHLNKTINPFVHLHQAVPISVLLPFKNMEFLVAY